MAAPIAKPLHSGGEHPPGGCTWPEGEENSLRPVWMDYDGIDSARAGQTYMFEPQARDPEGRALTYQVTKYPRGARVEWFRYAFHPCDDATKPLVEEMRPRVYWTPEPSQRGIDEVHVVATDGRFRIEKVRQIEVRDDWEGFFLPGGSYSVYAPRGDGQGLYHGPAFEMLIGAWIHRNEKRGPSDGRVYATIGLLQSTIDIDAVTAALGFDLSVERNPRRSFLIPYFGLEGGGLFRQEAPSVAQFTPFVGIHAYSGRNLFINLSGGYVFPTARIDDLLGYTGRLSVNFSLW